MASLDQSATHSAALPTRSRTPSALAPSGKEPTAAGAAGIFATMMGHINVMARDIAAMEVLGPNPAATLEYMKQLVKAEKAKAISGRTNIPVIKFADGAHLVEPSDAVLHAELKLRGIIA